MPYELKVDEADAILEVCVYGILSFEELCASRSEAANMLQEKHLQRLLVDLRDFQTSPRIGTLQNYQFGASFREAGIPGATRIAHVLPKDPVNVDNVKFLATVAFNRGVLVKEFDDVDAARNWLLDSKI
jgi:hypothetical protein